MNIRSPVNIFNFLPIAPDCQLVPYAYTIALSLFQLELEESGNLFLLFGRLGEALMHQVVKPYPCIAGHGSQGILVATQAMSLEDLVHMGGHDKRKELQKRPAREDVRVMDLQKPAVFSFFILSHSASRWLRIR